jgi:glycosyltransferase involved in cell wall biosynthesis
MNRPCNGPAAGPTVSIVTPSLNQGKYIERTIRSVLCQDYPAVQYIVVDAVSSDQTTEILQRYRDLIDVLIIEKDGGQADALNKGFARATGEILAYLNADDCYAHPRVLSRVVSCFAGLDTPDVLYGRRTYINEAGQRVDWFPHRPFSRDTLYRCDFIPQECTFWGRAIHEKAGAFIDRDYDFAMDYELWLRFLNHGARFVAVDEPIALFRVSSAQKSLAQWRSRGLAEIARLQQQYLGRSFTEAELAAHLRRHLYGANPIRRCLRAFAHYGAVKLEALRRKLAATAPIDRWVFANQVSLPRMFRQAG